MKEFEPIPVELGKLLDFLEESISDPQLRWNELRDMLGQQKSAAARHQENLTRIAELEKLLEGKPR